jgi:1-acyl-sn-glycerol-3-phosphate acyltransferase
MHRIAWEKPFDRLGLQKVGGVFAHPRVGLAALRRGMDLLVFPGGDVEAARPFGDRYQVTFAGRTGFVRLAREAGVPIAPVVICGAHAPYVILPGSQKLAKALGVERRFGSKVLPATIGSAVAAASLLLPPLWPLAPAAVAQCLVPWPSRIDVEAIDPIEIDPRLDDRAMSLVIEGRMQRAMDRMASARLTPWG